jgi:glycerol uptake facilitator-like aquaporin
MWRGCEVGYAVSGNNLRVLGGNWVAKLSAEFGGTATLAVAIVGSGAHASALTDSEGLALLINASVTAAVLAVLIATLLPVSGAHFNPAVTLVMVLRAEVPRGQGVGYVAAQVAGAVMGTVFAHWLFTASAPVVSDMERITAQTFIAETFATAGLVFIIETAVVRNTTQHVPAWVALWIGAGYFVTPSTGFANPAVTIGRVFTDTFTGIEPVSALWFIGAQVSGAVVGWGMAFALYKTLRPLHTTTQ